LEAVAVADPDVAADGLEVAVALAGLGGDVAADAVDVLLGVGRKRQAGGERGGEGGEADAVAAHGGAPVVVEGPVVMRRVDVPFRQSRYNRCPRPSGGPLCAVPRGRSPLATASRARWCR